ncbi:MAG: Crp/Fnr family transcriptional regulator [Proteobacteria bacterium]|nr:Crp/Fnr family transcriptional regulator [Pseudomonadota bacterium]
MISQFLEEGKHIFRTISIFKNLSDKHLSILAEGCRILNKKKGEVIFYQSDYSSDLYIVFDGCLKASLFNEEGEEFVITCFKKGDFFGELSLLDGETRSATIIVDEDAVLGVLSRSRFLELINREPGIAVDLLRAMAQRLRKTDAIIGSLAFLDVSERLLKVLQEIAKLEGAEKREGFYVIKRYTQKELASRIGASREAISKAMKILLFKKLVLEEGKNFLVSSKEKFF